MLKIYKITPKTMIVQRKQKFEEVTLKYSRPLLLNAGKSPHGTSYSDSITKLRN